MPLLKALKNFWNRMNTEPEKTNNPSASLTGDIWGGLASMLVALPSSIAFGILVYSTIGPEHIGAGALAGIIGAAALGIIAPLVGRTGGLISAPSAPAAAVLSSLVAGLLAANGNLGPGSILPLIALTSLFSAVLQVLYGVIKGGRLIKFVPYPVISGYLSGVGILIAIGQLPKFFSLPKGTSLFHGLTSPGLWDLHGLTVGVVTITIMLVTIANNQKIARRHSWSFGRDSHLFYLCAVFTGPSRAQ